MKAIVKYNTGRKSLKIALELITAIFIVLWIYVGITKLIDFRSFILQMEVSPWFKRFPRLVGFGGPMLEILIAFLLVFKRTRLVGYYASLVLMLMFTSYVFYLMNFLPELPCSCGGVIGTLSWNQHLALNIILAILASVGIVGQVKQNKMSNVVDGY